MTQDKEPVIRTFHLVCTVTLIVGAITHLCEQSEFEVCMSKSNLTHIPKNLLPTTKSLDMSQNHISELQISDIGFLSGLKVLKLSHNRIQTLDLSVFKFNRNLEHLDLSHNRLHRMTCYLVTSLKHLDLSFNDFNVLPACAQFGNLTQLSFLGLSAVRFQKLDLLPVTYLNLNHLLLVLGGNYVEENVRENLPILNTKTLHFVFHPKSLFSVQMNIAVKNLECLQLTNIKLNDENCQVFVTFLLGLTGGPMLLNLTLNHMETPWTCLVSIFRFLWPRPVEHLNIYNLTIDEKVEEIKFVYPETTLKSVTIEHITKRVFLFSQTVLYRVFSEMNIMMLTISDTPLVHMLCPDKASTFRFLNFSQNVFTDSVFGTCSTLARLETLILQKNSLKNLFRVSLMTKKMASLEILDLSRNSLGSYTYEDNCTWVKSIVLLNLSSNTLTDSVFRCLPPKVQVLDLHNNRITNIPKDVAYLESLQELNVAFNSLTDLPGCGTFSSLAALIMDHNSVSHPSADFFQSCQKITSLKAGNNPFQCTCELREFVKSMGQVSSAVVQDWPNSYKCHSPDSYKGTLLKAFHVSPLSCNTTLLILTIVVTTLVLAAIVTFLCCYFDMPWYLRMMCQWTQTRHRARNVPLEELQRNLQFHAFISYSGLDSVWVKNELLPNLEKENLRICLHERNFVPGKSIVENIITFIEKSYKAIFVLSPNFIQSEWCHYELYFAHHKLFREGSNNLILILLKPIPEDNIPRKYHKLRALMAQRTYLEWPTEKSKHGLFWANIRAAFNIKLILASDCDDVKP
ncbi:toll-like receptor 6 [Octodon degus]|uniref:Toll-like receptor 6 n=1 Tax=Octodon degus TaxID=10160 RepID=A0A6P3FPW1_OCTDE|nr:toll-like receptor 6 [Octodon degus]